MKTALRKDTKARLKALDASYIAIQSNEIIRRLSDIPAFRECAACSVYLSMAGEVNTWGALRAAFESNKRVFIPKVTGRESKDMFMLEIPDMMTIDGFPKSNWGIPEPPVEMLSTASDGVYQGIIDLVLVPGVLFDVNCGRIGHGKGYYDCFIERVSDANNRAGKPAPTLIGLALLEQISADSVPMESHDRFLDYVVTPQGVYTSTCQKPS